MASNLVSHHVTVFPRQWLPVSERRMSPFQLRCALCVRLPSVCSDMVCSPSSELQAGHLAQLHGITTNGVTMGQGGDSLGEELYFRPGNR